MVSLVAHVSRHVLQEDLAEAMVFAQRYQLQYFQSTQVVLD